ncbi:MAG: alpha-L-fucosidase [Candidatus Latescibacterota bacterium]
MRNTDWFASHGWGVFCHYLTQAETTADQWNRQVDAFDVAGLARQLQSVGAPYFFLTVTQGSGHYCAPNETYDRIAGIRPSKCSKRDLVLDLYDALHPLGIDLLLYMPADGSNGDMEARKGLGLRKHWHDVKDLDWSFGPEWSMFHQPEYQRNWEEICRDFSLRWGSKVRGWWIDGAYAAHLRYPEDEEPNLRTFAAVLRAGNPDALVAFNPGVHVPVIPYSDHEDFTAGEIAEALPECKGPFVSGSSGIQERYHILSYLGKYWCAGEPRFPDEMVCGYTKHVTSKGGVITWDVPIQRNGLIPEAFVRQLGAIGKYMRTE